MKLYARLLFVAPLIILVLGYSKLHNPDEQCGGLADKIMDVFFYTSLVIAIILSLVGAFRKTQQLKTKFEPVTFSTIILALFTILIFSLLPAHTGGEKWIYAVNNDAKNFSLKQDLALRKNGNFTVNVNGVDFGCSFSGSYVKNGDTIILDEATISKADSKMSSAYLIKSKELVPLPGAADKIAFSIVEIK